MASTSQPRSKRQRGNNLRTSSPPPPQPQPPHRNDAAPESWSRKEKKNFRALGDIQYQPTRFLSDEALNALGIREDVYAMLRDMGLERVSRMDCASYHGLTRQFLATLDAKLGPKTGEHYARHISLTFKIGDQTYTLTPAQICKALGFRDALYSQFRHFADADEFWNLIGDAEPFHRARSKASSLRNPVLWVVHRFIAGTLFPRMDIGKVKSDELCLLFRGLRRRIANRQGYSFSTHCYEDVNLGGIFATELVRLQRWATKSNVDHRFITSSGMLAPLFLEAGVPLSEHYEDASSANINIEVLMTAKVLARDMEHGRHVYLFRDAQRQQRKILLPNTDLTNLGSQANIEFHYGDIVEPRAPQRQRQGQQQQQGQQPDNFEDLFGQMQLEPLPYQPETPREEYFFRQYENQRRFNTWVMEQFQAHGMAGQHDQHEDTDDDDEHYDTATSGSQDL